MVGGNIRRVNHVGGIKTVVAKFVVHDFICREITCVNILEAQSVGCYQQVGLAYAVGMESVGFMPDRAYCVKDFEPWGMVAQK